VTLPLADLGSRAHEEASTSTVDWVSFVLVITVVANGCANQSFHEVRRPVTSQSDRLRDGPTHVAPPSQLPAQSSPDPARTQERAQLPQGTDEPDPQAVIDWLLKQKR